VFSPFEWSEAISGEPKGNITAISEIFMVKGLIVVLYMMFAKSAIMRAVENISSDPSFMLVVVSTIAHIGGNRLVTGKGNKARNEWDICESFSGLPIDAVAGFVAEWTFTKVSVWSNIAATCIRAAIVEFWLETSKKCRTRTDPVNVWKGRIAGKGMR
jgi:hypothetical protein